MDALAPVIEGSSEVSWQVDPRMESIEALLYDAAARDELGEARAAEASLERALELAEPEGIILPFALAPVQGLLSAIRGTAAPMQAWSQRFSTCWPGRRCAPGEEAARCWTN